MLRSLITSAGVLLLGASAFAQSNAHSMLRPVTSTVKDAGVYHLGTGTWTRHADTTNGIANDIIYSNTCPTGYYAGLLTKEYVADEGRIPGPGTPGTAAVPNCQTSRLSTNVGCNCNYNVCGFQIAYCSGLPGGGHSSLAGPVNVNVGFQQAYTSCALPAVLPKAPGTFDLTSLPGAGLSIQGCWLVTIDLDATSQTLTNFAADGSSCTWSATDTAATHRFGWTFQNQTTVTGAGNSYVGPLIAGSGGNASAGFPPNPTCSQVDGTRWDTLSCTGQGGGALKWPNNTTEDGWGMDTDDRFRDDTTNATGGPLSPPSGPGCYYFGGNPGASFHLKLFANTGCVTSPGTSICRPFVTGGPVEDGWTCPCNSGGTTNQPTTPGAGCDTFKFAPAASTDRTGGALLSATGTNSLSTDALGNPGTRLNISVVGMPMIATESAYLLAGSAVVNPLKFGQGLRCCGGQIKRLQIHSGLAAGTSAWPQPTDFSQSITQREIALGDATLLPGAARCYFVQLRAVHVAPGCVAITDAFDATNAVNIVWGP